MIGLARARCGAPAAARNEQRAFNDAWDAMGTNALHALNEP